MYTEAFQIKNEKLFKAFLKFLTYELGLSITLEQDYDPFLPNDYLYFNLKQNVDYSLNGRTSIPFELPVLLNYMNDDYELIVDDDNLGYVNGDNEFYNKPYSIYQIIQEFLADDSYFLYRETNEDDPWNNIHDSNVYIICVIITKHNYSNIDSDNIFNQLILLAKDISETQDKVEITFTYFTEMSSW